MTIFLLLRNSHSEKEEEPEEVFFPDETLGLFFFVLPPFLESANRCILDVFDLFDTFLV